MKARAFGILGVAVAIAALWVMNCSGPQPSVTNVRMIEPRAEATPYRVEATIHNKGNGQGQVAVTVRLRDRASDQTIQEDRKAVLKAGETTLVVVEMQAPRGDYTPEVEVEYPPR